MPGRLKNFNLRLPALESIQAECLFLAFSLFLIVQLLVNGAAATTVSFYAILLPLLLWYAWDDRQHIRRLHRLLFPAALLFAYTILHAFFLTPGMHGLGKTVGNTLATCGFVVAACIVFSCPQPLLVRLFNWLCAVATLGAAISILLFFLDPPEGGRLMPVGRARHPVLGASAYAVMGLITLHLFRESEKKIYLASFAIIALMVLLTGSRAPIALLAICALIVLIYPLPKNRKLILIILGGKILLIALLFAAPFFADLLSRFAHMLTEAGSGYRLQIWATTLDAIAQKPLFGHGMQARLDFVAPHIYSPHNLYLAAAFHTGIIGLLLLLLIIGHAMCCIWQKRRESYGALCLILLVHGLLSGITDHGQFVKGPAPLWIIFWLPLCMVWGNDLRTKLKTV